MVQWVSSGTGTAWSGDQVLVAARHYQIVQAELSAMGIGATVGRQGGPAGILALDLRTDDPSGADLISRVMPQLRERLARRYDGWVPPLGHNRLIGIGKVDVVEGQPTTFGGGSGGARVGHFRLDERQPADIGSGVTLGVVDTGIVANPWLAGAYVADPHDFEDLDVNHDGRLDKLAGHGTFVAGLALRYAPGATIRVAKVLSSTGVAEAWDVANAIVRLGAAGVDVINLSLGCYTDDDRIPFALDMALGQLDPRVVVVAAAGNHESARPYWPAADDRVVAVGAAVHDEGGWRRAGFSNHGPWVDLYAPGERLDSTFVDFDGPEPARHGFDPDDFDGVATWGGTSFSAAVVSGSLADGMSEWGYSARQAVDWLRQGATRVDEVPVVDRDPLVAVLPG